MGHHVPTLDGWSPLDGVNLLALNRARHGIHHNASDDLEEDHLTPQTALNDPWGAVIHAQRQVEDYAEHHVRVATIQSASPHLPVNPGWGTTRPIIDVEALYGQDAVVPDMLRYMRPVTQWPLGT